MAATRAARLMWLRTVGDEHQVHDFSSFCPKAISGIGRLVDTLEDRSVMIPMQRKRPGDRVKRLREDQLDLARIRRQCRRWAEDHLETLRHAEPETPLSLNDRAADNWRALLAIADLAGGDWPRDALDAALALSAESDDEAIGAQLLADIRTLFDRLGDSEKPIASAALVEALGAMEERPWSEWRHGKPITAPQMARLLKPFSIRPRNVRTGSSVGKGYHRWQFEDAFDRYLPEASQTATPLQQRESDCELPVSSHYTGDATSATPLPQTEPSLAQRSGVAVLPETDVAAGYAGKVDEDWGR